MATRRTYKCDCGITEVKQSMKEPPLTQCPKCQKPYRQLFHSPTYFVNRMKEITLKNAHEILERGY